MYVLLLYVALKPDSFDDQHLSCSLDTGFMRFLSGTFRTNQRNLSIEKPKDQMLDNFGIVQTLSIFTYNTIIDALDIFWQLFGIGRLGIT